MPKPIICCVVGTRPEAIKMAPVVLELRRFSPEVDTVLISTGQHREILNESLSAFGISSDEDLAIMQHGQTLAQVTSRALDGLDALLAKINPSLVIAQGDTTTTFSAAMAAFYQRIKFAHIEAGLRTESILSPFPEEFNRRAASLISAWDFPPTTWAKDNLLREGKDSSRVIVTGNTGIDAVLLMADRPGIEWFPHHPGRLILLTTHRRENWGEPQKNIARACVRLVNAFDDVRLVVALHPNPAVREALTAILGGHPQIDLIEPPPYEQFVHLMKRCYLILSDSGGVQEEAPAFGIPVLVLRETTERPEGVTAGTAKLVGTSEGRIFREGYGLLSDLNAYGQMANAVSPYGDGRSSARVRYTLLSDLGISSEEPVSWNY